jgi:hypothetical protein
VGQDKVIDDLPQSFRSLTCYVSAGFRQYDYEFFAAETAGNIALPDVPQHLMANLNKYSIACLVPENIVEPLKMVYIEHYYAYGKFFAFSAIQFYLKEFFHVASIE